MDKFLNHFRRKVFFFSKLNFDKTVIKLGINKNFVFEEFFPQLLTFHFLVLNLHSVLIIEIYRFEINMIIFYLCIYLFILIEFNFYTLQINN